MFFFHVHREVSILTGELPEESVSRRKLDNLKGPVGLILPKVSEIRVTIPIDLSTWAFIPLPRVFNSRRVSSLLDQSLVLIPQQSEEVRRRGIVSVRGPLLRVEEVRRLRVEEVRRRGQQMSR